MNHSRAQSGLKALTLNHLFVALSLPGAVGSPLLKGVTVYSLHGGVVLSQPCLRVLG